MCLVTADDLIGKHITKQLKKLKLATSIAMIFGIAPLIILDLLVMNFFVNKEGFRGQY
jgi:hypothetical protein